MDEIDWEAVLGGCEMGAVAAVLTAHAALDVIDLEVATWRERVRKNRSISDQAAELAARSAVNVMASALEMDAKTRLQVFLHICARIKAEQ